MAQTARTFGLDPAAELGITDPVVAWDLRQALTLRLAAAEQQAYEDAREDAARESDKEAWRQQARGELPR